MSETDLLLTSEVARVLGVSPATVCNLERKGDLPATRTASGVRLYVRRDVDALATTRAARSHRDEAA
jgi:excisionase family DNA binding protein